MNSIDLQILRSIQGKRVNNEVYFHISLIDSLHSEDAVNIYCFINDIIGISPNFVKVSLNEDYFSLLEYGDFEKNHFPELKKSTKINMKGFKRPVFCYQNNPPILHRKELLLPPDLIYPIKSGRIKFAP